MSAMKSLIGWNCVRCALKGHKCQAQMWLENEPLCLRCANDEPCCYDTAAELGDADRYREAVDVFTVPLPTAEDRERLAQMGKPQSLYSQIGRSKKSYLTAEEQKQILEDMRTLTARETADKNKVPITTVQALRAREMARIELAGRRLERSVSQSHNLVIRICEFVEERFGLPRGSLKEGSQKKQYCVPRRIVMYLAVEVFGVSTTRTAAALGRMHHSTVVYSRREVAEGIKVDNGLRATVEEIKRELEKVIPAAA